MQLRLVPIALALGAAGGCATPEQDSSARGAGEPALRMTYQCKSGRTVRASYPSNSVAVVEYEDRTLQMSLAVSASGARYVGQQLEWWTKGSGPGAAGTLLRHEADGTTGAIVDQCEQRSTSK